MTDAPTQRPAVSFKHDVDGDLHLLSSDPDAARWVVTVLGADGEVQSPTVERFVAYPGCPAHEGETAWCVEVFRPRVIEIRRMGAGVTRLRHPDAPAGPSPGTASTADLFARDATGRTPLFQAAEAGDLEAVRRMIFSLAGTGLSCQRLSLLELRDAAGLKAGDVAEQRGHSGIARLLREEQARMEHQE